MPCLAIFQFGGKYVFIKSFTGECSERTSLKMNKKHQYSPAKLSKSNLWLHFMLIEI